MKKTMALFLGLMFLVGCTSRSIKQIDSSAFTDNAKIENAIFVATKELGWTARKVSNNAIEARLINRKHEVKVLIPYAKSRYSINYVDSKHMNYNNKKGTINRNYNRWITNLNTRIQKELNK